MDGRDTGFLTVLFAPGFPRSRQADVLAAALKGHAKVTFGPLITSVSAERLRELEASTAKSSGKVGRPSLTSYWRVDARALKGDETLLKDVMASLRSIKEIERVTRDKALKLAVSPNNDPLFGSQRYLEPAPVGINAHWAWEQAGGDGQGWQFVDIEQSWPDDHADLPAFVRIGTGMYGGASELPLDHGAAVLGIVAARDNRSGIIGIAPESTVRVASVCVAGDPDGAENAADALASVFAALPKADVVVIETTVSNYPLEADPSGAMAAAIGYLVDADTVVVEAAGNAGHDLARFPTLDPQDATFLDTGAIIVGSSLPSQGHLRNPSSNFGARVNCFAWGSEIVSAGYGDLSGSGRKKYTKQFSGTSGASAIVAGAALLLMGIYKAATGTRLSPAEVRDALALHGTKQTPPASGTAAGSESIGTMPDLKAIVETLLPNQPQGPTPIDA